MTKKTRIQATTTFALGLFIVFSMGIANAQTLQPYATFEHLAATAIPASTSTEMGASPLRPPGSTPPYVIVNGGAAPSPSASAYPSKVAAPVASELATSAYVRVIVEVAVPLAVKSSGARAEGVSAETITAIDRAQQAVLSNLARLHGPAFAPRSKLGSASGSDSAPNTGIKTFQTVPFLAVTVAASELATLANDKNVVSITLDALHTTQLNISSPLIGATVANTNTNGTAYTGAGVVVAILDTGVDKTHPFLAGRVVEEACYSSIGGVIGGVADPAYIASLCPAGVPSSTAPGSAMPCTDVHACLHGTHVAGIVAGSGSNIPDPGWGATISSMAGVAPQVGIIAINIFTKYLKEESCGVGKAPCIVAFTSDIISGLERVYTLRSTYNIASVNMSIGGSAYGDSLQCDTYDPGTKAAIANLRSVNIATVVASGNGGYPNGIDSPGCLTNAVSVGASVNPMPTGMSGAGEPDSVAYFSNSNNGLKLLAPGHSIYSSIPGAKYEHLSGTSMATPQVAGAWALLKQAKPGLTVDEGLMALQSTGVLITDPKNNVRTPRINVGLAVASLAPNTLALVEVAVTGVNPSVLIAVSGSGLPRAATAPFSLPVKGALTLLAPTIAGVAPKWSGCTSVSTDLATCSIVPVVGRKAITLTYGSPTQNQVISVGQSHTMGVDFIQTPGVVSTSGLPVALTSNTMDVCMIQATKVIRGLRLGQCRITATQVGNGTYLPATPVTFSLNIAAPQWVKISNSGTQLPQSSALGTGPNDWACTRDTTNGLTWEVKTTSGLRDTTRTYTNYRDPIRMEVADSTVPIVGLRVPTLAEINADTNSVGYVKAVNATSLCGISNWRVPNIEELRTTTDTSFSPATDPQFFPNSVPSYNADGGWNWQLSSSISNLLAYAREVAHGITGVGTNSYPESLSLVSGNSTSGDPVLTVLTAGNGKGVVSAAALPATVQLTCSLPSIIHKIENNYGGIPGLVRDYSPVWCDVGVPHGQLQGIVATAEPGSEFLGWATTDDCATTTTSTCTLLMDRPRHATAIFGLPRTGQTITFSPTYLSYITAGQSKSVAATASSGLPVVLTAGPSETCTISGSGLVYGVAAGACTITATQGGSSTYSPVTDSLTVSIVAVPRVNQTLTISPNGLAAMSVGGVQSFTATASSGLTVVATASPSTSCTMGSGNAPYSVYAIAAGLCTIQLTQEGSDVYYAATMVRSFNITTVAPQTLTFNPNQLQNMSVGADQQLTVTASSGLTVVTTASPSTVCSITNMIHAVSTGTCTITATQGGSSTYSPVTDSRTFSVTAVARSPQTITFSQPLTDLAVGSELQLAATASSGLALTWATTGTVCTLYPNHTVRALAAGLCIITVSQAGSDVYESATAQTSGTVRAGLTATTISTTANPPTGTVGKLVIFTITVSGGTPLVPASGTVDIYLDGVSRGTIIMVGNTAHVAWSFDSAGPQNFRWVYSGSELFGPSAQDWLYTVNGVDSAATTLVLSAPRSPKVGAVVVSAILTSDSPVQATGNIVVTGTTGSCTIALPQQSCTLVFSTNGVKKLQAVYAGDTNHRAATASLSHRVGKVDLTPILMLLLD